MLFVHLKETHGSPSMLATRFFELYESLEAKGKALEEVNEFLEALTSQLIMGGDALNKGKESHSKEREVHTEKADNGI